MKRIVCLFVSVFFLAGGIAYAQGELDAYKLSQTDLNGTARYLGMSGAFGALGGDISSMSTNPAGLGVYRSSEVVTTISLSSIKTNTNWNGSVADVSKTRFNFDNIAYVGYFPTGNDEGLVGWNIGLSYNRVKNYNRSYRMRGKQQSSLSDYVADMTAGYKESALIYDKESGYDPYFDANPFIPWMSVLGYEAGYFYKDVGGVDEYVSSFAGEVDNADLIVNEKGSVGQYNIAFATNISDRFFLGATLAITDMDYSMTSNYTEDFPGNAWLSLDNGLSTSGTGYAFNIGAIARPLDFLRIGIGYNSPTWYKMSDYFHATASTDVGAMRTDAETPSNQKGEYHLRTPDRWIFSVAGIGPNFLVSVDYELTAYKRMNVNDLDGYDLEAVEFIKKDFGNAGTLKVGAEYKITPQFSVRAGTLWRTSPMKAHVKGGTPALDSDGAYYRNAIGVAGTTPNYTVDKGTNSYSVGLGYRFTPNFYADLACVYREYKEDAYAFPSTFYDDGKPFFTSTPASLKTKTTQVALTLGYKF